MIIKIKQITLLMNMCQDELQNVENTDDTESISYLKGKIKAYEQVLKILDDE